MVNRLFHGKTRNQLITYCFIDCRQFLKALLESAVSCLGNPLVFANHADHNF